MSVTEAFRKCMGDALLEAVEFEPSTTFGITSDDRLAYWNREWVRMAEANGGLRVASEWPFGRNLWDAIPAVLRPFYENAFRKARETGDSIEHTYECSSPTHRRLFRMVMHPFADGALLIRNHAVLEVPHAASDERLSVERYVDAHGHIAMCSNCRRARRVEFREAWDWVPAFVEQPPALVTHSLCGTCFEIHYPA